MINTVPMRSINRFDGVPAWSDLCLANNGFDDVHWDMKCDI